MSDKLNEYHILTQVGEGAYGKVYKVEDSQGRIFAMKVMPYNKNNPRLLSCIKREIKMLQKLKHNQIVKMHKFFQDDNKVYLILNYVEYDLKKYLAVNMNSCTMKFVKKTARQILKGLKCIHDNNILHRDIKSSNILIDSNQDIKITDFGLSRLFDLQDKFFYTQEVVSLGYRAPEILLTQNKYSTAIDMWSFGVLLIELVTGKCPFQADNELNQLIEIVKLIGTPPFSLLQSYSNVVEGFSLPVYNNKLMEYILFECKVVMEDESSDLWFLTELISKCLDFNPKKRIDAETALKHSFLLD